MYTKERDAPNICFDVLRPVTQCPRVHLDNYKNSTGVRNSTGHSLILSSCGVVVAPLKSSSDM